MRKININKICNVHFIGIGGISMSALALICKNWGMQVTGSDRQCNEITESLSGQGIKVFIGHSEQNLCNNPQLVVYTSAVDKNNIELVAAKKRCKYVIERAKFLRIISDEFSNVIAISGTHGKTTTCAMLASIFMCAGLNPTVHIGGLINGINTNCVIGDKKIFITEACEYKKHLLKLKPTLSAVLNIEKDHMECYKSLKHLTRCFKKFLHKGKISVSNFDMRGLKHFNYTTYFKAKDIKKCPNGCYSFTAQNQKNSIAVTLGICGKQNIQNALCAITISKLFLVDNQYIQQGLLNFTGVARRFETLGKLNNATIIRDYAHHPTEIQSTINTLNEINKPYIIIFQPHTYSRTQKLLKEFLCTLGNINNLYIYKTYAARETQDMGLSALQLASKLTNAQYIDTQSKLNEVVNNLSQKDINLVFVGAGDIGDIAKQFLP